MSLKSWVVSLAVLGLGFLSGCAKDVEVAQLIEDAGKLPLLSVSKDPGDGSTVVEAQYPGLAVVASQVLGKPLTKTFRDKVSAKSVVIVRGLMASPSSSNGYVFDVDDQPLSPLLAKAKFTKQLVEVMVATANSQPVEPMKLKGKDFQEFVEAVSQDIGDLYTEEHAQNQVGRMFGSERVLTRQGLLFAYLKAYLSGNFVDRAGNVISKPTITSSGVPNGTITGLLSVFLEAFYDYTLSSSSPLLMQKDKVVTYVPVYVASPQNPAMFIQQYSKVVTNNWFTNGNKEPTASNFVPWEEVPDTGSGPGLTPQKVRYIRYVAELAGEKSKALSGLVFRLFGSVNLGFVAVFGKFNIGDNDTLAKLLDTTFQVSSNRLMEMASYQFFKRVDLSVLGLKGVSGLDAMLQAFDKN